MENRLVRLMRSSGPARFFVPLGIVMIVFGILMMSFHTHTYLETTGRVTAVEESLNDENSTEYDITFTYTVDGKEYESFFSNMGDGYRVGSEVAVFYDPERPGTISNSRMSPIVPPLVIALGALAAGFGILQTRRAFGKSR